MRTPDTITRGAGKIRRFDYNHFFRYILAIFPRLQYSEYGTQQTGDKWVAIWLSWMGDTFWVKRYLLNLNVRNF